MACIIGMCEPEVFFPSITMSSISSMDTVRPPRSASPASPPTLEDDIAYSKTWLAHDDKTDNDPKGKSPKEHHADFNEHTTNANRYSPTSDQDAETRRVEQVRWYYRLTCACELTRCDQSDSPAMGNH